MEKLKPVFFASKALLPILFLFCILSYFNAWLSDDSFISFKVVDNFVQGNGLRWNIDERVQVFTNPLLVLFLSPFYFLYKNIVFWSFLSSFLFGAITLLLLWRMASSRISFWIGVFFLFSSRAFFDYIYSGLENSLNYCLEAAFFLYYWKEKPENKSNLPILVGIASIGIVSRIDFFLIFLLPLCLELHKVWKSGGIDGKLLGKSFLFSFPAILWFVFSAVYYGSLLPNTYYAKTNVLDSRSDLILQGLQYYSFQFRWDGISLFFPILLVSLTAFSGKNVRPLIVSFLFGIPYLLYILLVGGDFMAGRFFTYVILLLGIGMVRLPDLGPKASMGIVSILFLYNILFPSPFRQVRSQASGNPWILGEEQIADEKLWYYQSTGFLRIGKADSLLKDLASKKVSINTPNVIFTDTAGMSGFLLSANVHVIDIFGLGDPLLARIPGRGNRAGHKFRDIPLGYVESLEQNKNLIVDPDLKEYYDSLLILVRGDLWDIKRWDLFLKFQFGEYRKYVKPYSVDSEKKIGG